MKRNALIIALIVVVLVLAIVRNFIFTTTTPKPTAMKLLLPKESEQETATNIKAALTLLLYNNNTVFAFRGTDHSKGNVFTVTDPSFRNFLIQTRSKIQDTAFTVIIKPDSTTTYKSTVDVLDEMTINNIKKYAMVDVAEEDKKIIDSLRKR